MVKQILFLIEPMVKLFLPARYFFDPKAGGYIQFYSLLVMLWTLVVWGLFGGAITRIAAVQVAPQEKVGLMESLRFAGRKYLSYVSAPVFPLVFVALLLLFMVIFGVFHLIPGFGDILIDGLLWPVVLLLGLAMAVVLVGLVGWPLMAATISTEGTDSWEAVSRSYSYVYQAPWNYVWYGLVAMAYGAVVVFFVGLMGSLTVYLSEWGVSQTPLVKTFNRNPSYLFVYAPQSFGWRTLLLEGQDATVDGDPLVTNGEINQGPYDKLIHDDMTWYNQIGASLVWIWVVLLFMLILGFGYSYFWSASTIIYLLMRRKVDDAELDEVYLEEEETAKPGVSPVPTPPIPPATPLQGSPAGPSPTAVTATPPVVEPPPAPGPVPLPLSPSTEEAPAPSPPPPMTGDGNTPS